MKVFWSRNNKRTFFYNAYFWNPFYNDEYNILLIYFQETHFDIDDNVLVMTFVLFFTIFLVRNINFGLWTYVFFLNCEYWWRHRGRRIISFISSLHLRLYHVKCCQSHQFPLIGAPFIRKTNHSYNWTLVSISLMKNGESVYWDVVLYEHSPWITPMMRSMTNVLTTQKIN